jgi:hypothetical protein
VLLELDQERRVLFSGDLGHYDQPIIRDPVPPPSCDYLLVESTYGDRLHDPEDPKVALARIINDAAQRQAPVLIPAFAVGRTQEIVYLIRELEDEKAIPVLPVAVDSPMAAATTQAYANRKEEHDEEYASILRKKQHPLRTHSMMTASTREESKRLNDMRGTRIIISASGMMTGGRVLHHAMRVLPNENATVIFVGYSGPAGNLVRLEHSGGIETGYAHMSRFADGIKVGNKVKRLEVLGYVGSTGRSTGPHLHFSASKNKEFFDAEKLDLDGMRTLGGAQRSAFEQVMLKYNALLEAIQLPEPLPPEAEPEPAVSATTSAAAAPAGSAPRPPHPLEADLDEDENAAPPPPPLPAPPAAGSPKRAGSSIYLTDKELLELQGATDDGEVN